MKNVWGLFPMDSINPSRTGPYIYGLEQKCWVLPVTQPVYRDGLQQKCWVAPQSQPVSSNGTKIRERWPSSEPDIIGIETLTWGFSPGITEFIASLNETHRKFNIFSSSNALYMLIQIISYSVTRRLRLRAELRLFALQIRPQRTLYLLWSDIVYCVVFLRAI